MGSETPARAMDMAARSNAVPRLSADSTPMATPVTSQMIEAPAASDSVTGSRSTSRLVTGWLLRNE